MFEKIFRKQIHYIANAVFIILWIIYFVALFYHPYLGLSLQRYGAGWVVTHADLYGEGYRSGVRVGDLIIKIDDQDPGLFPSVQKWREVSGGSVLEVKSSGSPARIVKVHRTSVLSTFFREITMALVSLAFWILGVITWLKRPFLVPARALYWLNWFVGLAIILAPASARQFMWGRELETICFSFIPPLLVNFISVFPVETKNRTAAALTILPLAAISLLVVILLSLKLAGLIFFTSLLRNISLAQALAATVIVLWRLASLARLPAGKPEKNQVIIIFAGLAVGLLPFALFAALPVLLSGSPILNPKICAVFTLAIPVAFSYVIVNKYLPDGRWIFEETISYLAAGFITAGVLSCLLLFSGLVAKTDHQAYEILFSLTLTASLFFSIIKNLVKAALAKVLTVSQEEFRKKINELNENLSSISEDLLLEEIISELKLEGAFMTAEDGKGWYLRKAAGRYKENAEEQSVLEDFFFSARKETCSASLLPAGVPAEVLVPIFTANLSGAIFLGHRCSHVKFQKEELGRLTSLGYRVGQRLIVLHVINKLSQEIKVMAEEIIETQRRTQSLSIINRLLFKNLENERMAVAREIHDGPLQLGLEVSRRLKRLLQEPSGDEDIAVKISDIQEITQELNYQLRSVCADLRPSSLADLGLIPAVESWCQQVMQKEPIIISLKVRDTSRDQRFKEDIELGAFRFLQEGLTNVVKHSGSPKAEVRIALIKGRLELSVSDSGKGFDTSKIDDWLLTGAHLGIIGMQERIKGLDGEFAIQAEPGHGVQIKASIPIN